MSNRKGTAQRARRNDRREKKDKEHDRTQAGANEAFSVVEMIHQQHLKRCSRSLLYVILNLNRCLITASEDMPDDPNFNVEDRLQQHLGGLYEFIVSSFAYEPKRKLQAGEITREQYDAELPKCLSSNVCNVMLNMGRLISGVTERAKALTYENNEVNDPREMANLECRLEEHSADLISITAFFLGCAGIFSEFFNAIIDSVRCLSEDPGSAELLWVEMERERCRKTLAYSINMQQAMESCDLTNGDYARSNVEAFVLSVAHYYSTYA